MKRFITLILLTVSMSAMAQYPHHNHRGYGGWGWVAPAVIGGVIGYEIARPAPVVVQQPPIVVQQPPVVVQQPTDVVYINGIAYRKQLMLVNGVYQEVLIRI
jgi:hypothetical protein